MGRKKASTPSSAAPIDNNLEDDETVEEKTKIVYKFPLTKFRFEELPREVQRRIWRTYTKSAAPQHVEVRFGMKNWWSPRCRPEEKIPTFTALSPTPTVLHICHNSRVEGLRYLKLCFRDDRSTDEEKDQGPVHRSSRSHPLNATDSPITTAKQPKNRIFINPEVDTLYVYFDAWVWPYMQGIQDWLLKPYADDDGKSMEDFARTWNKRRIESLLVYWERGDSIHHTCDSMMVIRQENRGRSAVPAKPGIPAKPKIEANMGFSKAIRKFCHASTRYKGRELQGLLGFEIDDEIEHPQRWDRGWEGMIQYLMHQDCSHLWK